jgi:hypothetical protein
MGILTKDALLGASDLVEREVELPSIGGSVRVRSLPAAYANQALSEALEVVTGRRGEQTAHVNTAKLEALQVLHGMLDPKLNSLQEAFAFAEKCGPAWRKVVETIDDISGIDKETVEKTQAMFPAGGSGEGGSELGNGAGAGADRPDLSLRAGA